VKRPEGKRLLGRPRRKWENDIKIKIQELGFGQEVAQSGSEWGNLVGCCNCGNEHPGSIRRKQILG
jgi:hypothetical protein